MSSYTDFNYVQYPSATMTVEEERRKVKVTYKGESGKKFTVMITQKPNPIGFAARLPGDRRKP